MRFTIAKIVVRVIGTAAGILGIIVLLLMLTMIQVAHTQTGGSPLSFLWLIVCLPISGYFMWVAYAVWFRYSPVAVRHVFYLLGFYSYAALARSLDEPSKLHERPWLAVVVFAGLIGVLYACRAIGNRLSLFIFPEPSNSHEKVSGTP